MPDQAGDGGEVGAELAVEAVVDARQGRGDGVGGGRVFGGDVEQGGHRARVARISEGAGAREKSAGGGCRRWASDGRGVLDRALVADVPRVQRADGLEEQDVALLVCARVVLDAAGNDDELAL